MRTRAAWWPAPPPPPLLLALLLALLAASTASSSWSGVWTADDRPGETPHASYIPLPARTDPRTLRDTVAQMFDKTWANYMALGFPRDELRPVTCDGTDTLIGNALTLIDALDTLFVMDRADEFRRSVRYVAGNVSFDADRTVNLFETNIRVLGGLLSAHAIIESQRRAGGPGARRWVPPGYAGELLALAEDLASRLMPAFETPTGIPYGSVNLRTGVAHNESLITSTAAGGTLLLEWGVLSRLTENRTYERVAARSTRSIWRHRSARDLVGAHINIVDGTWTHKEAGIGSGIDSFYEYLLKAHLLFGDGEWLYTFWKAYEAVEAHLRRDDAWYVETNMDSGLVVFPIFQSLMGFWPGLQSMVGDTEKAMRSMRAFMHVWRAYGGVPEGFNIQLGRPHPGQESYPLRPELVESLYHLYRATHDEELLAYGREILVAILERSQTRCGFATVRDVGADLSMAGNDAFVRRYNEFLERRAGGGARRRARAAPRPEDFDYGIDNQLESFFLSETLKYLFLLFDEAVDAHPGGGAGASEAGAVSPASARHADFEVIFTTEGHLIPMYGQIASLDRAWDAAEDRLLACAAAGGGDGDQVGGRRWSAPGEFEERRRAWAEGAHGHGQREDLIVMSAFERLQRRSRRVQRTTFSPNERRDDMEEILKAAWDAEPLESDYEDALCGEDAPGANDPEAVRLLNRTRAPAHNFYLRGGCPEVAAVWPRTGAGFATRFGGPPPGPARGEDGGAEPPADGESARLLLVPNGEGPALAVPESVIEGLTRELLKTTVKLIATSVSERAVGFDVFSGAAGEIDVDELREKVRSEVVVEPSGRLVINLEKFIGEVATITMPDLSLNIGADDPPMTAARLGCAPGERDADGLCWCGHRRRGPLASLEFECIWQRWLIGTLADMLLSPSALLLFSDAADGAAGGEARAR